MNYKPQNGQNEFDKDTLRRKFTYLVILIQLKRPCKALKFGISKDFCEVIETEDSKKAEDKKEGSPRAQMRPAFVRSPFNMTTNIEDEV